MPKKTSQKNEKKVAPKKIEPAILVALIALTGTLTTALLNSSVAQAALTNSGDCSSPCFSQPWFRFVHGQ